MVIIAAQSFSFRVPGQRGRAILVHEGDKFWISTTKIYFDRTGLIGCARNNKTLGDAYFFSETDLDNLFHIEGEHTHGRNDVMATA